jgi:hypothetical protein
MQSCGQSISARRGERCSEIGLLLITSITCALLMVIALNPCVRRLLLTLITSSLSTLSPCVQRLLLVRGGYYAGALLFF